MLFARHDSIAQNKTAILFDYSNNIGINIFNHTNFNTIIFPVRSLKNGMENIDFAKKRSLRLNVRIYIYNIVYTIHAAIFDISVYIKYTQAAIYTKHNKWDPIHRYPFSFSVCIIIINNVLCALQIIYRYQLFSDYLKVLGRYILNFSTFY